MVARGDLGVEMLQQEVPIAQKRIVMEVCALSARALNSGQATFAITMLIMLKIMRAIMLKIMRATITTAATIMAIVIIIIVIT